MFSQTWITNNRVFLSHNRWKKSVTDEFVMSNVSINQALFIMTRSSPELFERWVTRG